MNETDKIIVIGTEMVPDHHHRLCKVTLRIGEWRKRLRIADLKSLIARGLNNTLDKKEYRHVLAGYLITDRKVYLVLDIKRHELHRFMHIFYDEMRERIAHFIAYLHSRSEEKRHFNEDDPARDEHRSLFAEFHHMNYILADLLIGKKINLQYYDPHLARMKNILQHQSFCSVIDYAGAKSPVHVTRYIEPLKEIIVEEEIIVTKKKGRK